MKKTTSKANTTAAPAKSKTAVRGKYFNLLQEHGSNLAIIDPALMPHFPDSESVNRALHAFLAINAQLQAVQSAAPRPRSRPKASTTTKSALKAKAA